MPTLKGRALKRNRLKCTSASPAVHEFFAVVDNLPTSYRSIAKSALMNPFTFTRWKSGETSPRVVDIDAVVNQFGYRLALVKMEE